MSLFYESTLAFTVVNALDTVPAPCGLPGGVNFLLGIDQSGNLYVNGVAATDGAVTSVFTRTGAVVATTGDYTVAQVTGAAPLASPTFTGTVNAATIVATGVKVAATDFIQLDTAASFWRLTQTVAGGTGAFRISQDGVIDAISILGTSGFVGINKTAPNSALAVVGLPVYANNAAAISGGLTAGDFFRTGSDPDPVCVVH